MNQLRRAAIAVACALASLLVTPATAGAAQGSGNPVLRVAPATLTAGKSATVTVTGTDYLVPPHAPGIDVFGGVYLLFGWVHPGGAWGPSTRNSTSNDGVFGVTYSYRGDGGDASTRDDGGGTMRFVSFTAGGLSGDATDFHMDDNGNWATTLTIPGPTYEYEDLNGGHQTVNCLHVQCGVFTIGAHGKASSTNERFTPITFVAPSPPTTVGPNRPGQVTPTTVRTPPITVAGGGEVTPSATVAPNIPATSVTTGKPNTTASAPTTVKRSPSTTTPKSARDRVSRSTTSVSGAGNAGSNGGASGRQQLAAGAPVPTDGGSSSGWIAFGLFALVLGGGAVTFALRLFRRARIAAS